MRLAIISRDNMLFSCKRLSDVARLRGHTVDIIDPFFCLLNVNNTSSSIFYKGKNLEYYNAVIPRISPITNFYGISILRQLEIMGSYAINGSIAITQARDKLFSLQLLANHGIAIPITIFADLFNDIDKLINMVNGTPLVIKLIDGAQGIGVILAETYGAAKSIIEAFRVLKVKFLLQEFIYEAKNCDIRCLVLGNQVIASIKRQAKSGEFRSNLHLGGSAKLVNISNLEEEIAIQSAKILGLNIAGIDILRTNRGPLVIEVNGSPGFMGIENTNNLDVASMIIDFIEIHSNL